MALVTGDMIVQLIAIFGSLILVTSGLIGRRLSWSKGLRMALVWLGLFMIVTLFVLIVNAKQS